MLHHSAVFENQPVGTLVGIMTASDPEGSRVQFRIARDQAGVFKVSYPNDRDTTHVFMVLFCRSWRTCSTLQHTTLKL